MTRIRYYPTNDPNVVCTSVFFAGVKVYRAYLQQSQFNGEYLVDIKNARGELILAISADTVEFAKRQLRQALINLGVKFNIERRIKKDE